MKSLEGLQANHRAYLATRVHFLENLLGKRLTEADAIVWMMELSTYSATRLDRLNEFRPDGYHRGLVDVLKFLDELRPDPHLERYNPLQLDEPSNPEMAKEMVRYLMDVLSGSYTPEELDEMERVHISSMKERYPNTEVDWKYQREANSSLNNA